MAEIRSIVSICLAAVLFTDCSSSAFIRKSADVFRDEPFSNAHIGMSIYDASSQKSIYSLNANKYFLPASNVKLFTLYAALKYMGDSLPGIQYDDSGDTLFIYPTGDPSFLQPEFKQQPVIDFLKRSSKPIVA